MAVNIYASSPTDGIETEEQKLYNLVNQYRVENGLPAIPLSKSLTTVANRHAIDLSENLGTVTHSWSDAFYDSSNPNTYSAMWQAPQRLNTGYPGNGYENVVGYGGLNTPNMTATQALESWKNSPLHNDTILSQGIWSDITWQSLGVGLSEGYATLWFGEEVDPTGSPLNSDHGSTSSGSTTDNLTGNVIRFWNEQLRAHFFTASPQEVQDILNNPNSGYQNEGNEFDVPKADTPGTLPVYRYKNQKTSTYFYTFQVPSDITPNYPDLLADGIAFNAFTSETKPADAIPIYRFWNEGRSAEVGSPVHFFTSTESNKQDVINNFPNFKYEEAGFYAYPTNYS